MAVLVLPDWEVGVGCVETSIFSPRPEWELLLASKSPPEAAASGRREIHV